jgi:hypothetical protein
MTSLPRPPAPPHRARRHVRSLALTGMLTLAVAGCAVAQASGPAVVMAAHPTASSQPAAKPATPKQRAEADAAGILAAFAVPSGAVRLTHEPSAAGGILRHPPQSPLDRDLIDKAAWYQVPGTPMAVLAWESAHLPKRFARTGSGTVTGAGGVSASYDMYTLAPVAGVLDSRGMLVEAVAVGAKTTDVRVDAQVTWRPARLAASMIPLSKVKAVTLTLVPGPNGHAKPPKPVTVTGPARVAALVKLVNSVPSASAAEYSCPGYDNGALNLAFAAKPGGHPLAVTAISLAGCEFTSLTIGGIQYALGGPGPDNGHDLAVKAVRSAGLTWKVPA